MIRRYSIVLLTIGFAIASCSEVAPPASELPPEVADLPAVFNGSLPAATHYAWEVDSVPLATIGIEDGPSAIVFARIASLAANSRGELVVADAGTAQIHVFDSTGAHVRSWGGVGQGPGEFLALAAASVAPGDTVLAYDSQRRLLSVFSPGGNFLRRAALEEDSLRSYFPAPAASNASAMARSLTRSGIRTTLTSGGTILLEAGTRDSLADQWPSSFIGRDASYRVWLRGPAGPAEPLGWLESGGLFALRHATEGGRGTMSARGIGIYAGSFAAVDPAGERVCAGDGAIARIICVSRSGSGLIFSWDHPLRSTSDATMSAARDSIIRTLASFAEGAGVPLRSLELELDAMPRPEYEPVFSDMMLDAGLNVWVHIIGRGADSLNGRAYSVFSGAGKYVTDVVLPEESHGQPLLLSRQVVLPVLDNDIPLVRVYRLIKPGS